MSVIWLLCFYSECNSQYYGHDQGKEWCLERERTSKKEHTGRKRVMIVTSLDIRCLSEMQIHTSKWFWTCDEVYQEGMKTTRLLIIGWLSNDNLWFQSDFKPQGKQIITFLSLLHKGFVWMCVTVHFLQGGEVIRASNVAINMIPVLHIIWQQYVFDFRGYGNVTVATNKTDGTLARDCLWETFI